MLHQVGVSFDLYYDGRKHKIKILSMYPVAATREIGLEVSADKTKYMVTSRDQNAGQILGVRIDKLQEGGRVYIFGNNFNE